jgi:hypothetical protein
MFASIIIISLKKRLKDGMVMFYGSITEEVKNMKGIPFLILLDTMEF